MTWNYTGTKVEGRYLYVNENGTQRLLEHAPEAITEASPEAKEWQLTPEEKKAEKSTQQSNYHKRRYQLIKSGEWTGHMPKS